MATFVSGLRGLRGTPEEHTEHMKREMTTCSSNIGWAVEAIEAGNRREAIKQLRLARMNFGQALAHAWGTGFSGWPTTKNGGEAIQALSAKLQLVEAKFDQIFLR